MGNQVLLVTHQGMIDGHFKGIVRTHNKSQQMSLMKRDIINASDKFYIYCWPFSQGLKWDIQGVVQVSGFADLFVFENLLKDSSTFAFDFFAMLLLDRPGLRVHVSEDQIFFSFGLFFIFVIPEDQVELWLAAALVRPEHDRVRRLVGQLPQVEVLVKKLTSTIKNKDMVKNKNKNKNMVIITLAEESSFT